MKFVHNITYWRLKEVLHYNPETGIFIWLKTLSNRTKVGYNAGTHKNNGYMRIDIDGYFYYAHRLAFLYMTGEWPKNEIDHIDNIRDNNKWENLREVTRSQNNKNRPHYGKKNVSKGIFINRNKYSVIIHLGTFDTLPEAEKIRDKLFKELHGEYFKL